MGMTQPRFITISFTNSPASSLLDATTYYGGMSGSAITTNATYYPMYIPFTGVVRACCINIDCSTTTGTNEAWDVNLRKNNTTDYLIATVSAATRIRTWINNFMNIPVVPGDYIEMKMTTPTWATNPDGARVSGFIILECG